MGVKGLSYDLTFLHHSVKTAQKHHLSFVDGYFSTFLSIVQMQTGDIQIKVWREKNVYEKAFNSTQPKCLLPFPTREMFRKEVEEPEFDY